MDPETLPANQFLDTWHTTMIIGSITMATVGILIYISHQLLVSGIRNLKSRYDYINTREIRRYKLMFLCFGIAVGFLINIYGMNSIRVMGVWFFVRVFISIAGGTLIAHVSFLIIEYYYPTVLHKKLHKLRYTPRISKSGQKMRLLGEEEEDVHLADGMKAEEDVFSIDYDVWIDEKSGEVQVEKYSGHLEALQCNSCGFYTMKVIREEITRHPSGDQPGELVKNYECSYCKSVRATAFNISTKEADDYKTSLTRNFRKNQTISAVRIEVISDVSGKKYFEFQTVDQARKFLQEYEAD